jgi:signal transduction histidine kinase/DNA-binding response OmpR family regulator
VIEWEAEQHPAPSDTRSMRPARLILVLAALAGAPSALLAGWNAAASLGRAAEADAAAAAARVRAALHVAADAVADERGRVHVAVMLARPPAESAERAADARLAAAVARAGPAAGAVRDAAERLAALRAQALRAVGAPPAERRAALGRWTIEATRLADGLRAAARQARRPSADDAAGPEAAAALAAAAAGNASRARALAAGAAALRPDDPDGARQDLVEALRAAALAEAGWAAAGEAVAGDPDPALRAAFERVRAALAETSGPLLADPGAPPRGSAEALYAAGEAAAEAGREALGAASAAAEARALDRAGRSRSAAAWWAAALVAALVGPAGAAAVLLRRPAAAPPAPAAAAVPPAAGIVPGIVPSSAPAPAPRDELPALLDSVREAILSIGPDDRVVWANRAAAAMFAGGRDLDAAVLGALLADPDEPARPLDAAALRARRAEVPLDARDTVGRRLDGTEFPAEATVTRDAGDRGRLVVVVRDIAGRKAVENLKQEFVATVSHELRTPLTSLRGALVLLQSGLALPPARQAELLGIAHRNAERLLLLVNDLLDVEKLESGRMAFTFQETDLVQLVSDVAEANRPMASDRKVRLALVAPPPDRAVRVSGDPQRLQQVVANLLSNAIKYAPPETEVTLTVRGRDGRATVEVLDHGPGIPEAFRTRIFQKFAQADRADGAPTKGTGLGLAIAKAIAERHGGEIGFDSRPGETVFRLRLPLLGDAGAADPQGPDDAAERPPRVVVCDPRPDAAHLVHFLLELDGAEAEVATSGDALRRALQERPATAALIAPRLPDGEGIDLVRSLRADPRLPDLRLFLAGVRPVEGHAAVEGTAIEILDTVPPDLPPERLRARLSIALDRACPPETAGTRRVLVAAEARAAAALADALAGLAEIETADDAETARERLAARHFDRPAGRPPVDLLVADAGLTGGRGADLLADVAREDPPAPVVLTGTGPTPPGVGARIAALLVDADDDRLLLGRVLSALGRSGRRAEAGSEKETA